MGATFTVQLIGGRHAGRRFVRDTESAATCEALDHCGPLCSEVSVTCRVPGAGSWAVKRFRWTRTGLEISGWRRWVDGRFVGESTDLEHGLVSA